MKTMIIALTLLFSGLIGSVAEATPTPTVPQSGAVSSEKVVRVDYACGRGFHENQWGHCRPNDGRGPPRGYVEEGYGWRHRPPPPPPWAYHHRHHHYDDQW
jgi:hypothetical protein